MIYTCTTNPSLDYYVKVEENLRTGEVNRATDDYYMTGGKGVNVSIQLDHLMMPSVATGFLGGFVKEYYLEKLEVYHNIQARFINIEGRTRINLKLNSGVETVLNAKGPHIKDYELDKLIKRLERVDEEDIFILSGAVQEEICDSIKDLIRDLARRKVKIILDTNGELIKDSLDSKPFLIKPDLSELEELTGLIITDEKSIIEASKKLVDMGAQNVLVTLGKDGAYHTNADNVYCHRGLEGKVISTTGCGDSMIGAYVFNLQRGANSLEAFSYSCAASTATAFTEGLASRDQINEIVDKIVIEEL